MSRMRTEGLYRFPANKRAESATLHEQLRKVEDEAIEALDAYQGNEGDMRVIEELWDAIHAAEGALRKFGPVKVATGRVIVRFKNMRRGDYE